MVAAILDGIQAEMVASGADLGEIEPLEAPAAEDEAASEGEAPAGDGQAAEVEELVASAGESDAGPPSGEDSTAVISEEGESMERAAPGQPSRSGS